MALQQIMRSFFETGSTEDDSLSGIGHPLLIKLHDTNIGSRYILQTRTMTMYTSC